MPLLKVVLDTNIVVSAHLQGAGFPAFVLDLTLASKIQLYVTAEILEEYEVVLRRPRFGINPKKITQSIRLIKRKAKRVKPTRKLSVSPDPDDNRFIECAEKAEADYLVTGNLRHYPSKYKKTKVVSARQLIEIITPELKR
jgi:putative PIN family toxin of toxin-antitoxin system